MPNKAQMFEILQMCLDQNCDECPYEQTDGCMARLVNDLKAATEQTDLADTVEILQRRGNVVTITTEGDTTTLKVEKKTKTLIHNYGEEIKRMRKELKMTQEDFAEKIGVNRNTLQNWELGKTAPAESYCALMAYNFGLELMR